MTLAKHIKTLIRQNGPMDIGRFMELALGHPEYGYYMTRDPFGTKGDFTTAPEISQMFGEVIGAWAADVWRQMGAPSPFILLECGPGRGTLMADMLRATKNIPGFHEAAQIHLLETSPVLKQMQEQTLSSFIPSPLRGEGQGGGAVWHQALETIPDNIPLIAIANEFLDALPVRQLIKTKNGWTERVIDYRHPERSAQHAVEGSCYCSEIQDPSAPLRFARDDGFLFALRDVNENISMAAEIGSIFEFSPAREEFVSALVKKMNGAALFIDYGHIKSGAGDTLQAVKNHQYISPLEDVGNSDLTSHVDFEAIGRAAEKSGARVFGPIEQGDFLKNIGILQRAEALKSRATPAQKFDIEKSLQRLTAPDQMGKLFKVMELSVFPALKLSGF